MKSSVKKSPAVILILAVMLATSSLAMTSPSPVHAGPLYAGAADSNTVLIDGSGTSKSVWADQAAAAGFTVEVADAAAWAAKSTADFSTYRAIILPDQMCAGPSAIALSTRTTWGPAINGNVLVIGGDPDYHAPSEPGATQLIYNGIEFAGDEATKTGALIPLGCYSDTTILDVIGTITARSLSSDTIHMVASHPALTGLTDAALSNWGSSTHAAFTSYPGSFVPLAIQLGETGAGSQTFGDGTTGTPYLLASGAGVIPVGPNISDITPSSGPIAGGTTVVLTGSDFTGATVFTFGGTSAVCTVDSDTQITCTTPAHAAGVVDVIVTTPAGSITETDGFTYLAPGPTTTSVPADGANLTSGPTSLTVTFNKELSGSTANDSDNYIFVEAGVNNIFDTTSCLSDVAGDDIESTFNSVSYSASGSVTTLTLPSALTIGSYRLFICGTTSIQDLAGTDLNDGVSDTQINFTVVTPSALPKTGFPVGQITTLPDALASNSYSDTAMTLDIPSLGVRMPIVGVPLSEGIWDVSWLGNNAGYLVGSAYPTWTGNTVITGHVWDSNNSPGPFAELKTLRYGDQFAIHAFGKTYTYEVHHNKIVLPSDVNNIFQHEEFDWITLLTCEYYNPSSGDYLIRRAIRAVLINVR